MMKRYVWTCVASFFLTVGMATGAIAAGPQVELDTTMGKIKLELSPQAAPKTVDNFLEYVKSGFYDGTLFHRVIDGFMVQGGGLDEKLQQKPTRSPVANEGAENQKTGAKNTIGTIAMARTGDPHSATAQFFINVADNAFLNYSASTPQGFGYTVFGKVVEGMDVVNKIAKVETGQADVPKTPVVIRKASVVDVVKTEAAKVEAVKVEAAKVETAKGSASEKKGIK